MTFTSTPSDRKLVPHESKLSTFRIERANQIDGHTIALRDVINRMIENDGCLLNTR